MSPGPAALPRTTSGRQIHSPVTHYYTLSCSPLSQTTCSLHAQQPICPAVSSFTWLPFPYLGSLCFLFWAFSSHNISLMSACDLRLPCSQLCLVFSSMLRWPFPLRGGFICVFVKKIIINKRYTFCHHQSLRLSPTVTLPGSFLTFYVDWKSLIIALMVEMGIFTAPALFLKPLH